MLRPGLLGSYDDFGKRYCTAVVVGGGASWRGGGGGRGGRGGGRRGNPYT